MVKRHEFCDHCPGCRPAVIASAGMSLDAQAALTKIIDHVWDHETRVEERKAFIEVTLHNDRDPEKMRLAAAVAKRFEAAVNEGLRCH
jgi:hypothetical protein